MSKDILLPIFSQLPSYVRSRMVTVCKTWHEQAVACTIQLEQAKDWTGHFLKHNYHTIVRGWRRGDEVDRDIDQCVLCAIMTT
jgi:hypothetical protein